MATLSEAEDHGRKILAAIEAARADGYELHYDPDEPGDIDLYGVVDGKLIGDYMITVTTLPPGPF